MSLRNSARQLWMAASLWVDPRFRSHSGSLARLLRQSARIPSWTRGRECLELLKACYQLPGSPIIVEVGCFLGGATILFAGGRRLRGSGMVHCIDPFDGSGDDFSVPHYQQIAAASASTLRQRFDGHIREAGLQDYVTVHEGTAETVGAKWRNQIDLLYLDGDHSPEGARSAFRIWTPFLKRGGIVALHNTVKPGGEEGHDGYRRLALSELSAPAYGEVYRAGTTTFAVKQTPGPAAKGAYT